VSDKPAVRILILFYSRYGNTVKMAEEIAYGAKELPNVSISLRRIADDVPAEVISQNPEWSKVVEDMNNRFPSNNIDDLVNELPNYHGIIFGSLV
jgi:NAD(P)H dehydrogenase (quinone)